jgi:hypothetical protein
MRGTRERDRKRQPDALPDHDSATALALSPARLDTPSSGQSVSSRPTCKLLLWRHSAERDAPDGGGAGEILQQHIRLTRDRAHRTQEFAPVVVDDRGQVRRRDA